MRFLHIALVCLTLALAADAKTIDGPLDQTGRPFHLESLREKQLVAVVFLGVDCPLGRLYANRLNDLCDAYQSRGVAWLAVNSNAHDTFEEMQAFATHLKFPMIKDDAHRVADSFAATHSPEVFLLGPSREVIYSGRIDDQYAPGAHGRREPTRRDLEQAIVEALAGQPVSVPVTEAVGCRIDRGTPPTVAAEVTYNGAIASILDTHCVACHRPGQAAPFSLTDYAGAAAWSETIRDVVEQQRMPPWSASGGPFVNDPSLSAHEREQLLAWIDAGAPEGEPAKRPAPPQFGDGWKIHADRVFAMPAPFAVPKEGVLDYQEFVIDPGFAEDTWVEAVEIAPGNRAVVHHINVHLRPKGAPADMLYVDDMGDYYLAMAVPGNSITQMPPGTAKLIPAGWQLVLSVHYVPNGVEQTDQSQIALQLADPAQVHRRVATRAILDDSLRIAPFEKKTVRHEWVLEDDYTLFALYPHMHLRGRSMCFEATYPDGRREVLLDVARYDFAWQYRYVLEQAKDLPRGTRVTCTALYDNTADNRNNPDPSATVRSGRQTSDEMFQACFEICRTHEDRLAASPLGKLAIAWLLFGGVVLFAWFRRPRAT